MKRKAVAAVLTAVMVASMFTGCGSDKGSSSAKSTSAASAANDTVDEDGKVNGIMYQEGLPLVDEGAYTFSIFCDDSSESGEFIMLDEFKKQTNVDVDLKIYPYETATERLNLDLNSGDYADVIGGWTLSDNAILTYGVNQGVFIPLEDYFEKYCPNISAILDLPGVREKMTAPDGHIYTIPYVCADSTVGYSPYINTKWLENVGMSMPTTTDEFEAVLKAFKEQDANGNGDASDEIPMDFNDWFGAAYSLTNLIGSYGIQLTNWGTDGYFVEDGQVKNYAVDERYKALISYLADLYSEGLINENAITNDYSMFQSLSRGDENGDALVGVVLGWEETDKFGPTLHDQYVPCGPFADDVDDLGTDEPRWTYDYSGLNMSSNRICMSANCANPEAAMKFMNEFYDSEVSVEVLFGGISDGCLEKTGDDSYKVLDPVSYTHLTLPTT